MNAISSSGVVKTTNDKNYFSPWLFCPQPNPRANLRLFCFLYAGGNATIFRNWHERLPANVEVCAVQLPGRGRRLNENPFASVTSVVRPVSDALVLYCVKPFAFFGHSMGALLSFEITRQFRREGRRLPEHLFLSGRRAPHIPSEEAPTYDLPTEEFLQSLQKLNGTPAEVLAQPELIQLMLPLLRADFELCETYEYVSESPLDCAFSVYGGLRDPGVRKKDLEAWREQTTSSFSLRMVPGDHFFLNESATVLLGLLSQELHYIVNRTVQQRNETATSKVLNRGA